MSATPADIAVEDPVHQIGKYWWIPLATGVLTMLVGAIALFFPEPTLLLVGVLLGVYLMLWGAMLSFRGIFGGAGTPGIMRFVAVLLGVLSIFCGLVLMVRPGQSVLAAAWAVGFWWTLTGIMSVIGGIAEADGRAWNIASGLIGIVAGVIILAQPRIGVVTLLLIVGFGLLIQGAIAVFAGLQIRSLRDEGAT